jgi:sugar lactone lactonase YvrE
MGDSGRVKIIFSYVLLLSLGFFISFSVSTIDSASALSSLSGIIFEDENGNGILDGSDVGISNWRIQANGTLNDGTNNGPITIFSDVDGLYEFTLLPDGVYDLELNNVPNWQNTTQSIIKNLNLETDANISNDFGVFKLNRITGFVYNDTNGSLVKDPGDTPIVDWEVYLSKDGETITTTSDETSRYVFEDLEPGTYSLSVDLPSPYIATEPDGGSYEITTLSGTIFNNNFGLFNNSLFEGFGDILTLYTEELTIGPDGFLYAVNSLDAIIHKYDLDGNLVSTIGGPGVTPGTFIRPSGIAIDSQGNIFVSDIQTYIQKFDSSGNFLLGWGALGTDPSQFDNPRGLAIDSEDNVYVADGNNYRIQKFDNDGNFLEIISGPGIPLGFLQIPYDVTFDSLGDLYVADTGNNRIQIFDSNGVFKEAITNSEVENGKFNRPRAVTVDSNNFIYVADTYNNRIQVFDSDNNFVRSFGTLGNNPGEFANPSGIIATDDGKLYVTDTSNDRIQVFDSATGNFLFEFEFRESSVEPYFAAFDDSGNLLVADGHSHKIITIDPLTDSVISEFGTLGIDPGELRGPRGIAFDQDGNIYVGDNYNNRVNKYDSAGNFLLSWGDTGDTPGAFLQVRGMAIDSNGDVLVADTQNNRIQKFDSDGNFISLFDSFLPYQISLDDQDNLYVAEENADVVTKYDSNGNPTLVIGTSGAGPGEFLIPKGVTIDTNGDIFIADSGNGRIQKFDSDGNFIDMIGTLGTEDSQFNNPRGLTMDSDRNLWVCDTGNFRIQVFDNNLNYIKTVDFPSLGDPINNSPIAADESYSTGEDIPLPITLSASDADGDSVRPPI